MPNRISKAAEWPYGIWHYTPVKDRKGKVIWYRVANDTDQYIAQFDKETEALVFIRKHNGSIPVYPEDWKF